METVVVYNFDEWKQLKFIILMYGNNCNLYMEYTYRYMVIYLDKIFFNCCFGLDKIFLFYFIVYYYLDKFFMLLLFWVLELTFLVVLNF